MTNFGSSNQGSHKNIGRVKPVLVIMEFVLVTAEQIGSVGRFF